MFLSANLLHGATPMPEQIGHEVAAPLLARKLDQWPDLFVGAPVARWQDSLALPQIK